MDAVTRQPSPELAATEATVFSLFDGDLVNRFFSRLGWNSRRARDLAYRAAFLVGLTWAPMTLLALLQGLYSNRLEGTNFFADYAAYAQCLIALPLFVVAERIVARSTREAAAEFVETGVVTPADYSRVDASYQEIAQLRRSWKAEAACIGIAYALAVATLLPEFRGAHIQTWHSKSVGGSQIPTLPGAWALLVALPILNYWWLRLAWKCGIWTLYLYRMSRLHLGLVAGHPDRTGGIGFISEVQAKFALVIFAYGISNVAAVIAYKVAIEHAPLNLPPVWGPAVGFIIGAPLLFTVPLLMFTKQLFRTKRRALALYRARARRQAISFEQSWLSGEARAATVSASGELVNLNSLATIFDRVERMRIVPFDYWSATQLLASTLGSVATALPLLKAGGSLTEWLELLSSLLRHGSG